MKEMKLNLDQAVQLLGLPAYIEGSSYREYCDFDEIQFQHRKNSTLAFGYVDDIRTALELLYEGGQLGLRTFCEECLNDKNCIHVAALLLEILDEYSEDFEITTTSRARAARKVPSWQQTMDRVIPPAPDEDETDSIPLALMFSVSPTHRGTKSHTVRVRLMRPGARGGWIQSGLTWDGLRYEPQYSRAQTQALLNLHALQQTTVHYYYGNEHWVALSGMHGRSLAEALQQLADAGVSFIDDSPSRQRIDFTAQGPEPFIDIRRTDAGLAVQAQLQDGVLDNQHLLTLGHPAHCLITSPQSFDAYTDWSMHILQTPLTQEFIQLVREETIKIPQADIEEFEETVIGRLRRVAGLRSVDGSYTVPQPARPVLVVSLRQEDRTLDVTYSWHRKGGAERDRKMEQAIIEDLRAVLEDHASMLGAVSNGKFRNAVMDPGQAVQFMLHVVPVLQEHPDAQVVEKSPLPAYRLSDALPQVSINVAEDSNDWFDLNVEVNLDEETVPFTELFTALTAADPYLVLPSGTVLDLQDEQFDRLRTLINEAGELADARTEGLRMHRLSIDWWQELLALGIIEAQQNQWLQTMRQLTSGEQLQAPVLPQSFDATLRDYQHQGLSWLNFLRTHGLGGVLADDMGLGKTVQLLAALEAARLADPQQKFLVVAPTSVAGNWLNEARRFAPELPTVLLAETSKKRGLSVVEAVEIANEAQLIITSYAVFRLDFESFDELDYTVLILDEAQHLKNHTSKGYKQARQMEVPCKFVVTGTPVENNLLELWALVSLAAPGLLGGLKAFKDNYAKPIAAGDGSRLQRLKQRLRPFVLRRTKEQVAADLPAKTEQVLEVELEPAHRRIYDRRFQRVRQEVLGLVKDVDSNRFKILQSLTLLRQLALDPVLVDEAEAPSAKLLLLRELLTDAVAEGHKVLVFSQFTGFLSRARDIATQMGIEVGYLDGSTTQRNRRKLIEQFTAGKFPVFFISLKAGGFGINLTAADYCILLDPWWNPAAEAQAVDRAHRIGQDKPVFVYRLVAKDTIESKVLALQERKTQLFNDVLDEHSDSMQSGMLSADDFLELVH